MGTSGINKSKVYFWLPALGIGFFLNLLWEYLHSALYLHYQGGEITNYVLLRASLADAGFIWLIVLISGYLSRYRTLFIFFSGLVLAIIIERWALGSGRWAYSSIMPIIPVFQVGLTPTVQLALTGVVSFLIAKRLVKY